jgi:hypothetical protein
MQRSPRLQTNCLLMLLPARVARGGAGDLALPTGTWIFIVVTLTAFAFRWDAEAGRRTGRPLAVWAAPNVRPTQYAIGDANERR